MNAIEIEFAVQIGGEKCAEQIKAALKEERKVQIDVEKGQVIVDTTEPWSVILDKIEKMGKKPVLSGFGGQSAVAMINTTGSDVYHKHSPIQGVIRFSAVTKNSAGVVVDGVVDGLKPGLHGLHVHEAGDVSQGCNSLGAHYNPRGSPHGTPTDEPDRRHAGDLGNIRAENDGRATFRFFDPVLEVWDIIGRSVAITEDADDGGRGCSEQSTVEGNSGRLLACGIIARSAGILQNFKKICACDGVTLWDERNRPLAGGQRANQKL